MIELASEGAGEDVSFQRTRDELVDILERNGGHAEAAWGKGKQMCIRDRSSSTISSFMRSF